MTPSRDVRAQFYSRMGLRATTVAQPSQIIKEDQVTRPSCSSSAEDEENTKDRTKHDNDKEPDSTKIGQEADDRLAVECTGTWYPSLHATVICNRALLFGLCVLKGCYLGLDHTSDIKTWT